MQEEGWVVCRAFKKRTTTSQTKNMEAWDSTYFYDEHSTGVSSVVDPLDYITRQQQPSSSFLNQSFMCKKEIEAENLILVQSEHHQFVQLPQLESPSLPLLIKRPTSSASLVSQNNEEDEEKNRGCNNNINESSTNKVTADWRDLDKFVASQLSQDQEEKYEGVGDGILMTSFGGHEITSSSEHDDHMALLLLQSGDSEHQQGNYKLNEFFNSDSSSDIGICIFDK